MCLHCYGVVMYIGLIDYCRENVFTKHLCMSMHDICEVNTFYCFAYCLRGCYTG